MKIINGERHDKPKTELSEEAKRRKAQKKRVNNILNDASVFLVAAAGSVLRKAMPDLASGGETVARLTWAKVVAGIVVGCLVVAAREWLGKPDHNIRRQKWGKRISEALVIGYMGSDLLPYLIDAAQKVM